MGKHNDDKRFKLEEKDGWSTNDVMEADSLEEMTEKLLEKTGWDE